VSRSTGNRFLQFCSYNFLIPMKTLISFSVTLVLACLFLVVTSAFAQTNSVTTASVSSVSITSASISPVTTQTLPLFPRETYTQVPLNIGFVAPLAVGNIVQASTGKRIISHVSLHAIGGVGNALEGVEGSGIFNVQTDYTNGVQGAGVINIVGGDAAWAQGAGIANIVSGRFDGVQGAGVINVASKGFSGAQGAGIINIVGGRLDGVQGAGVINIAEDVNGAQGAGVINIADNVRGVQGSGVTNHAKNVAGLQIAGILNTAVMVTGAQIGLINTADDNQGVMLGLINFSAAHGIHVDLWTDEMRFIRLGLRTGNKNFYNLLTVGLQPFNGITLWSFGYGLGTQVYFSPRDYVDVSVHGEGVFEGVNARSWGAYGAMTRLRFLYGHEFAKNFSVFIGPTVNWVSYNNNYSVSELFPAAWRVPLQQGNVAGWIGVSGGFRF